MGSFNYDFRSLGDASLTELAERLSVESGASGVPAACSRASLALSVCESLGSDPSPRTECEVEVAWLQSERTLESVCLEPCRTAADISAKLLLLHEFERLVRADDDTRVRRLERNILGEVANFFLASYLAQTSRPNLHEQPLLEGNARVE